MVGGLLSEGSLTDDDCRGDALWVAMTSGCREAQVPFCEGPVGQFRRSTLHHRLQYPADQRADAVDRPSLHILAAGPGSCPRAVGAPTLVLEH